MSLTRRWPTRFIAAAFGTGVLAVGLSLQLSAQVSAARLSTLPTEVPLAAPWRELSLPKVVPNRLALVREDGVTVLRVSSHNSGSTAALAIARPESTAPQWLKWRWKVDRVLSTANMQTKAGDDFAARLYVFFDVPLDQLPFYERLKIRLARAIFGADVPAAALCYVWDNTHPIGHSQWSPYTNRVRVIVLQNGAQRVGHWVEEIRDLHADYRAAFEPRGSDAPIAAIAPMTGIALGNDTDNTREQATAWFGDVSFVEAKT